MADLFENPLGLDGFEFVEFTGPNPEEILAKMKSLGFVVAGVHKSKNVLRLKQGDANFILNMEAGDQAEDFGKVHGQSANAMAFRVKDAAKAYVEAVQRGAEPVARKKGILELDIPCIRGIGGSYIYLVDRYGDKSIYDIDFNPVEGAAEEEAKNSCGFYSIDHLTHNVHRGEMQVWAEFYENVFGFREYRYFDIEGKVSGLVSRAMTSPCGKIHIPINESKGEEGKLDQISEFLVRYNGEGIQHVALRTDDLIGSVDKLRAHGVELQDTNDVYFDMVDERLPGHGQNIEELRKRRILIDGAPIKGEGLLLQIFSTDLLGPIFFEFIERKGNNGFGEGNFTALFKSIELDQIRRGVLADA